MSHYKLCNVSLLSQMILKITENGTKRETELKMDDGESQIYGMLSWPEVWDKDRKQKYALMRLLAKEAYCFRRYINIWSHRSGPPLQSKQDSGHMHGLRMYGEAV